MSRKTSSFLLRAASILLLLLAVATVLPISSSIVSDLGYKTLCPFAPWSTLMLLFFAWLGWTLRRHLNSPPS